MKDTSEFLSRSLGQLLWKNVAPAILAMLVMALYQVVDGIMVGRRLGPDALAAVSIGYPVIALFVALAVMLGAGGNARIAVLLGSGEVSAARRVLSALVVLAVALGITGTVVVLTMGRTLTGALGATAEVQELTMVYLATMSPFFVGYILSFILEQGLRNDGRAGAAGAVMAGSAVLNIALDWVFLFRLDMGIAGAALASGIAISLSALIFLGYFLVKKLRRSGGLRLERPTFSLNVMGAIVANGSSELFSALAMGVVTLLFNRTLMRYSGATGVAAFAIVQYLLILVSVFLGGLATGAQPILGQNHGAGRADRVRGTLVRMLVVGEVMAVVLGGIAWFLAAPAAALFVPEHPDAVALTTRAMQLVTWSLLFIPLGTIGSMFYTAIERPVSSLVIAALRTLLLPLPALALLPMVWGADGIWLVPLFTDGIAAVVALVMMAQWMRITGAPVAEVVAVAS